MYGYIDLFLVITYWMALPWQGVSLHMSEESLQSLPRTPPTPGKHLFIPPPPSLAGALSYTNSNSNSSSQSQGRQDHGNLPLKKRKELASNSDQVRETHLSCIWCIVWCSPLHTGIQLIFVLLCLYVIISTAASQRMVCIIEWNFVKKHCFH